MNTRTRSLLTMTLTLISAFSWAQNASESQQQADGSPVTVRAEAPTPEVGGADFVKTLRADELQVTEQGAIMPSAATKTNRVLRSLSNGLPPSREGIPGYDEEPSADDVIQAGLPTNLLLRRTMENAERKELKSRIRFYENMAHQIIKNSGQKPNEEAIRLVLNRTVDVVNNIIRWVGRNSDKASQFLAQFYVQGYEIAFAYSNNPANYVDQNFPRAKVGVFFARMLFSNQADLNSDSANTIILIKLLGYLGQDINSDITMRREGVYKYALLDIMNIQKNDEHYQNILDSLAAKQEPRSRDVAGLRSQIARILTSLPN